jgi:hypothetical protein
MEQVDRGPGVQTYQQGGIGSFCAADAGQKPGRLSFGEQ